MRAAALLLALTVAYQTQPPAPRQAPPPAGPPKDFTLPAPKRFKLDNGLAVTMVPFGQVPKVTIRVVVEAANVHERADQAWLADLTGSLMREGTAELAADALAREFAGMGGELAVSVGQDTAYASADVLADRAPQAVQLLADVVARPRFPESEFERVKANLLRDLAIEKSSPQATASAKFAELVYGDHPYGRIFPTEAMVKGYTLDQSECSTKFISLRREPGCMSRASSTRLRWRHRSEKSSVPGNSGHQGEKPRVLSTRERQFALLDRAGAPQSTVLMGLRVVEPCARRLDRVASDRRPARWHVRVTDYREYSRAEGLHLFSVQHGGNAPWQRRLD